MKQQQRTALIESATRLFHQAGYSATGAREIAADAGVPPGSFTNHFRSKEVLGAAALDTYFQTLRHTMALTLRSAGRSSVDRIDDYFDLIGRRMNDAGWRVGCLIPDLAADVPARSEILRERLLCIMREQVGLFEAVLAEDMEGREVGDLASFVVAAWHGTLLRMKVEQGPEPLLRFRRVLRLMLDQASIECANERLKPEVFAAAAAERT